MTPEELALARFQATLLELLASDLPPAAVREQLRSDPELSAFRQYVDSFELRQLEVASCLVKQWGRRATNSEITDGAG